MVLVIRGVPGPDTPEGEAALRGVVDALAARPEVSGTFSYLDQRDPFFVGDGGGTFVVVGLEAPDGRLDRLLPDLRTVTEALGRRLRAGSSAVTLRWTGEAAINYDVWRASADETHPRSGGRCPSPSPSSFSASAPWSRGPCRWRPGPSRWR